MSFNIALSGLNAASQELSVVGNNIANASTTGFKRSRAEFADVYASRSGIGTNVGAGVKLTKVAQQFNSGTIQFTDNSLDLAIDGNGFFVMSDQGAQTFTRAGLFRLDDEGFIVNNQGARLQGFPAVRDGAVSGTLGDLQVEADNLQPQQTTFVDFTLNLDAQEPVLAQFGSTITTQGANVGVARVGAGNGYLGQSVDVVQTDGTTQTVNLNAGLSAAGIAGAFSQGNPAGVTASATSTATVPALSFNNGSGGMVISVNGVGVPGNTLAEVATAINTTAGLGTVSATVNGSGDLVVTDSVGADLLFSISSADPTDSFDVQGVQGAAVSLSTGGNTQATVGGQVDFSLDDGVTMTNEVPAGNVFQALAPGVFTPFVVNEFDPQNPATYNHATSATVFDSLGNSHMMTSYYVKERFQQGVPGQEANTWTMYVQIDGRDVGDADPNLPPPLNDEPTRASFRLVFNADGTLNQTASDNILISNWTPTDDQGNPTGARGPQPVIAGGGLPIPLPPESSNFEIRLGESTQFVDEFAVNALDQDGFATGRLADIEIGDDGTIFARYSNGENQSLGEVALANFASVDNLKPIGDTSWVQTNRSGEAVIGTPGSSSLGFITSGALEQSNVDLSAELVQLILAQRNFQANAKTISTADEITQTIINLR